MDEELIILGTEEVTEASVNAEDMEQSAESEEVVESVEVEDVGEVEIEVNEAIGWVGGDVNSHYSLSGRDEPNQHEIWSITGLEEKLDILSSMTINNNGEMVYLDQYSAHSGFAEFRQWSLYSDNNEVGRFVSLVYKYNQDPLKDGNTFIEVCSNEHSDVYGVTVQDSAICGYQDKEYCVLEKSPDRNNQPLTFAKVCILGVASVKQGAAYQNAKVGDYVVPDGTGCAVLSENEIGFRVVGVGQRTGAEDDRWNYKYVDIALVPQNDNVARVMKELEGTKQGLGNLSIIIDELKGNINNSIIPDMEQTNGMISDVQSKLDAAQKVLDQADEIRQTAQTNMATMKDAYMDAISEAQTTITNANKALGDVGKIKEDLSVLDGCEGGVAGFVAKVEEDRSTLATLNTMYGKNGTEITLINQKIDENGAAIQHLVAHADKYSVGDYSLTHNMTYNEAFGLLDINEYIYVPISEHTENSPVYTRKIKTNLIKDEEYYLSIEGTIYSFVPQKDFISDDNDILLTFNIKTKKLTVNDEIPIILSLPEKIDEDVTQIELSLEIGQTFTVGKVYIWSKIADTNSYWWQESALNVFFTKPKENLEEGYLWYTHNGVVENDVWAYEPRTLYRYNAAKGNWFPVARTNDSNARTMSFINQTAEEISSTVTNLEGHMSEISQTVDEISSTVLGKDGVLSRINQTAQEVMMGVYKSDEGASTLELLLEGMQSTANHSKHVCVGEFGGAPTSNVKKYTVAPIWSNGNFSFVEATETTEEVYPIYYFDSDKTTYYRKQIDSDTYEIYTIGNQTMANLDTRVSDTESEIESWTLFESEAKEVMSAIKQNSDADAAEIISMVSGIYTDCIETKTELSDNDLKPFQTMDRYSKKPVWKVMEDGTKGFVFDGVKVKDGEYCTNNKKYYYALDLDEKKNIIGYKKYEIKDSNYASIIQKTSEDKTSVSLEVGGKKVNGGVFVEAINDEETKVLIEADKIGIAGTAVFSDSFTDDKTTISGNNIRTGVIRSNNYSGPATYKMYGAKIQNNKICVGVDISDCIYYTPKIQGTRSYVGEEEPTWYYAKSIEADVVLITEEDYNQFATDEQKQPYQYIVTTIDFDLIPSNVEALGTKFDLNNGTIYSKNLELDRGGNLSITGKISATSGWIGDENGNGFEIQSRTKDNQLEYYLGDNQISHNGVTRPNGVAAGAPGVYLGPDGIGLGNGYFYIDNTGNMLTRGEITMKAGTSNNQVLHIDTAGNLTLGGNINLAGSITWGASNSPVKVLYSVSGGKPTKSDWDKATDEDNSTTTIWHTTYQSNDYYASYSYDGGQNWDTAIKIKGEDFSGGDAGLSESDIFDMLTDGGGKQGIFPFYTEGNEDKVTSADIYINATYIKSGTLKGRHFISQKDNHNQIVDIQNGQIFLMPSEDQNPKMKIGLNYNDNSAYPYIQLGAGTNMNTSAVNGLPTTSGTVVLYKDSDGFGLTLNSTSGYDQGFIMYDYGKISSNSVPCIYFHQGTNIKFNSNSSIDFTGVDVTGLKITFG